MAERSTAYRGNVANEIRGKRTNVLNKILGKLAHLDLTGCVQYDSPIMKAHGGYSDVFIGTASILVQGNQSGQYTTMKVAIKRLRVHKQKDRDFAKMFAKELYIWSKLEHRNILPLQGLLIEEVYPSIVAQWMENGTLREFLMENVPCDVENTVHGIARGLRYMHEHDVIHSDLKADNVLIGNFGEPLICDFGISRMLFSSMTIAGASTGGLQGSMRWTAPELLDFSRDSYSTNTKESDVWAFGMTIYEIFTRKLPFSRHRHDSLVIMAILGGELPSRPADYHKWSPSLRFVWEISEECWNRLPANRITMDLVVSSLDEMSIKYTPEDINEPSAGSTHDYIVGEPPAFIPPRPSSPVVHIPSPIASPRHGPLPLSPYGGSVNPIIKDAQYICLDLSSCDFAPQMPGTLQARKFIPVHEGYLTQIATYPSTSEVDIVCKAFGSLATAWTIRIRQRRTISVGDVLRAVHGVLRVYVVTRAEWKGLPETEKYEAWLEYNRRCDAEPGRGHGVCRIDLLGKRHWFGGLKRLDDDTHNFELLVKAE